MESVAIAKLIEASYQGLKSNLDTHEVEDRLINKLLGKELNFTTGQGNKGVIRFQSLGLGKRDPSTAVTLQAEGVEFEQDKRRLTLDLRYVFYQELGHASSVSDSAGFLISSPIAQKLGPSNILIKFIGYGNTIYRTARFLPIFAGVLRKHQAELHQTAIEVCDEKKWEADPDIELSAPVSEQSTPDKPWDFMMKRADDISYIREYINYIHNHGEIREWIDNRNTNAQSKV
jgi:hypothetical protein